MIIILLSNKFYGLRIYRKWRDPFKGMCQFMKKRPIMKTL
jgi:hypothetical protein